MLAHNSRVIIMVPIPLCCLSRPDTRVNLARAVLNCGISLLPILVAVDQKCNISATSGESSPTSCQALADNMILTHLCIHPSPSTDVSFRANIRMMKERVGEFDPSGALCNRSTPEIDH